MQVTMILEFTPSYSATFPGDHASLLAVFFKEKQKQTVKVTLFSLPHREHTATVIRELKAWLESNPDTAAHYPVEVRFAKGDNIMISPACGRDTCFINIIVYR